MKDSQTPYTITIYLKSDNEVYLKVNAEFAEPITSSVIEEITKKGIKALLEMSGSRRVWAITKQEYEENAEDEEA